MDSAPHKDFAQLRENADITALTTFGIPVKAKWYGEYSSEKELLKLSRNKTVLNNEVLHLGGGSNLLFLGDYDGVVLRSCIKGRMRYDKDSDTVYAIAGAGENWSEFVDWCVAEGLGGLENMAGIPGTVGAAPVQNVGAYGREAKDVVHAVECFDMKNRTVRRFTAEECRFGYRDSFFKHEGRSRYVVLRVSFRLMPDTGARCLDYGPLKKLASELGRTPTIAEVAEEVKRIRASKLPDPKNLGSVGSFFKNPVVHNGIIKEIETLTGEHLESHPVSEHHSKLSAAWLIDKAGLKGARVGGAEVYDRQPLVIVNTGGATGEDVAKLAEKVRHAVRRKFMIDLRPEANYIDTKVQVRILGSGTSKGVPEIGCLCPVCTSADPKDSRMRASALVRTMGMTILIDPGPDFRRQALDADLSHIDAVLITHAHYDHVGGLDDLRPFCLDWHLPVFCSESVAKELRKHYDYCFAAKPYPGVPVFDLRVIGNTPFYFNGLKIVPVEVEHGPKPIFGYRIGDFAYITDAKKVQPWEAEKLEGVETMVVNALRYRDHFSHFSVDEALEFIKEVNPRRAYLTHFNHEIGCHKDIKAQLPENVSPAFDGFEFTVPEIKNHT